MINKTKTKSVFIARNEYVNSPSYLLPDNGAALLASLLIKNDHKVTILDYTTVDSINRLHPGKDYFNIEELEKRIYDLQEKEIERIVKDIKNYDVDFVSFKLWTGISFKNSIAIAENLKKVNPELPIFAGGPHVDIFKENIYSITNAFDVLVQGEGEPSIVALADSVAKAKEIGISYSKIKKELKSIPNLIYKQDEKIVFTPTVRLSKKELDELPTPIYSEDVYPAMKGNQKIKIIVEELSRGCPYKCNFCSHANKSGRAWRAKSSQKIINEIKEYISKYNIFVFRNGDSNTPPNLVWEFANKLLKENISIKYALITHINFIDSKAYQVLSKSGCLTLFVGIESGDQHLLDSSINKKIYVDDISEKLIPIKDTDISLITSMIIPLPEETNKSKQKSLDLLLKIRPDAVPVNIPIVIPYSPWAQNPKKFNIELGENYLKELMFWSPTLFLPPSKWTKLPYKINGKDFNKLSEEANDFTKKLEDNGITTQVIDDIVIMSKLHGTSIKEFRDTMRKHLFEGNSEGIQEIVNKINHSIRGV